MISIDAYYWTISTSAQAIAAVLGFAIAAYIFAYSHLEVLKNDGSSSVIERLIIDAQRGGRRIVIAAIVTGMVTVAIDIVLLAVPIEVDCRSFCCIFAVVLTLAALVMSALLVMRTVNPDVMVNIARNQIEKAGASTVASGVSSEKYLDAYRELERVIRNSSITLAQADERFRMGALSDAPANSGLTQVSVSSLIKAMFICGFIDGNLYDRLLNADDEASLLRVGTAGDAGKIDVATTDLDEISKLTCELLERLSASGLS